MFGRKRLTSYKENTMFGRKRLTSTMLLLAIHPLIESLESRMLLAGDLGTYTSSWLGNSDGTATGHIMQGIQTLYVGPDGKSYAATGWDEGGSNVEVFNSDGSLTPVRGDGTGSWGRSSNAVSTGDGTYMYQSMSQDSGSSQGGTNSFGGPRYPAAGTTWQTIRKYDIAANTKVGFTGGAGYDGSMLITTAKPVGLAVYNNEMYSAEADGKIRVYNANTMSLIAVRSWTITDPGALEVDAAGYLWMLQPSTKKLIRYSTTGALQTQQINLASYLPTGFGIDKTNNRVYVANNNADQNVLIYNSITTTPAYSGTFGVTGGIFAGSGATIGTTGPLRFNHPVGVGVDTGGNVYVACDGSVAGGGTVLEKYNAAGGRQWVKYGIEFVDNADISPASETDLYTKEEHFVMDYSKPAGQEWTYKGYTNNPFKYPQDPRNNGQDPSSVWVRDLNGQRFLFQSGGMMSGPLFIYRFNAATDGEIAIPCGQIAGKHIGANNNTWPANEPASGQYIWRDLNGNGQYDAGEYSQPTGGATYSTGWGWNVDAQGNVWTCDDGGVITKYTFQSLDANGSPQYDYAHATKTQAPSLITENTRLEYDVANDTMYLGAFTTNRPNTGNIWGIVGSEILKITDWNTGNRTPALRIQLPYAPANGLFMKAMSICGNYAFVSECRASTVHVYDLSTGADIGTMDASSTLGALGWVDIPYGVRAYKRPNGEYLVLVEEDGRGKILMYRWTPSPVAGIFPSSADIGSPAMAGSSSFDGTTYTLSGAGSDIWNTSDQFQFDYKSVTGDQTLIAKVTSLTNTDGWAKAGVMFRDSTAAGSIFADMVATPGSGVSFQWRGNTGGDCGFAQTTGVASPSSANPVWVKLVKSGNSFTGFYSTNGTNWLQVGSAQTLSFTNSSYLEGLAVTSHNAGALATASFANLSNTSVAATLTGTVIGTSGSWNNQGDTIAKVFDGNLNSFFDAPDANASGAWVGLDLGTVKTITTIKYAPRSGYESRMAGGYFQVSNTADFSIATTIYTIAAAPTAGVLTTQSISVAGTWRYIRYVAPADSWGNIAEMEVWGY